MSRVGIALVTFVVFSSIGIGLIIANSDFYMADPRFKGRKVKITEQGAVLQQETTADAGDPNLVPQMEIVEATFNFGILDPHQVSRRDFIVKNVGSAPLRLENKGTSCKKCTIAGISREIVPPGEEAIITLEWNTGPGPHYSQTATIGANDPARPSVQLRVEGKVRVRLGASPEELTFEGINPGRSASGEVVLYSQVAHEVEIGEIKSTRPGFTWQVLPAEDAVPAELEATWARKLLITTPGDLPSGSFEESVFIKLKVNDGAGGVSEEVDFDVRVRGRVKRSLAIYGPEIDGSGLIDVGVVDRAVGRKLTFKAKIHDEDRRLHLERIECAPNFLKCALVPSPGLDPTKGLYDFTVEIPPDAPVCDFMAEGSMGQVRIVSSHPRIGEIPLALKFAVREPDE